MGLCISLPALLGICLGIRRYTQLPAGAAPLAGLSCIGVILFFGGVAGVLPAAAWAAVAAGWVLLVAELASALRQKDSAALRALCTPGSGLFWGGSAVLALRLAYLQPAFLNFDEYSFWGTATHLVCDTGTLYPACETGRPWVMTELPGIPLAGYWFQLAGGFAPWKAIFAVDLLLLAALAAAVSCCEKAAPRLWGPALAAAVLLPTAMTIPAHNGAVNTTWLELLGDLPAGILCGGAVAFWLAVRDGRPGARWLTLPVLWLAASVKSNTLPLALAAAGLVLLDAVFFPAEDAPRGAKALLSRGGFGLCALAVPAVEYLVWSRYTLPFVLANATTGGMGDTANASLPEVVINGVKMLLGGTGTPFFEARRTDLADYGSVMRLAFTETTVSIFGSGAAVCGVIGLVFALALWLAPGWRQKLRVGVLALAGAACFGGYWLMLLLSYSFIFKDSSPTLAGLASYARYMDSCYAGWLLLALALLLMQAAKRTGWRSHTAAFAAAALFAVFTLTAWQPQYTVYGVPASAYADQHALTAQAEQISAGLEPDDRVFLIRQGDDGYYWFWYAQALLPNIVTYGAGGGTYGIPVLAADQPYYQSYTPAELTELITESGANCVLVAESDDIFVQSYGELFTDGLAAAEKGVTLYRAGPAGYAPAWTLEEEVQP